MGIEMELVRQFNSELSSIYENKPPISKAKMASITRFAVKALKHYKHIVHSVEKFIQKCRNEYKVAGLYVLDSIIRQSRHQFGPEKDLFGPRFQKDIKLLFQHIYQCPSEDKPKVVRVLNLWQKNGIYSPDIISPLIDMASTSPKVLAASIQRHKTAKATRDKTEEKDFSFNLSNVPDDKFTTDTTSDAHSNHNKIQVSHDDEIQVLKAQLEQQRKQQELLQQQLQMQIMATKQQTLQMQMQQQQLQSKLQEQMSHNNLSNVLKIPSQEHNTGINNPAGGVNILSQIRELSQQLERDKQTLVKLSETENNISTNENPVEHQSQFLENFQQLIQSAKGIVLNKDPRQNNNNINSNLQKNEGDFQREESQPFNYDDASNHDPRLVDRHQVIEKHVKIRPETGFPRNDFSVLRPRHDNAFELQPPVKKPLLDFYAEQQQQMQKQQVEEDDDAMQIDNEEEFQHQEFYEREDRSKDEDKHFLKDIKEGDKYDRYNRYDRHEEREGKSDDRHDRRRHQFDERNDRRSERSERRPSRWEQVDNIGRNVPKEEVVKNEVDEKEEMKRKEKHFIPPPQGERMTVASITVWVGRLPKGIHPDTIRQIFAEYGEVQNLDLIDARGCCFVTMSCRSEADRALRHLKNRKIEGYDVRMAWGQPKGLQEFSKYWEESFGSAYVPWHCIKDYHLPSLLDGCIIDEDTLPPGMKIPLPEEAKAPEISKSLPADIVPPMFLSNLPHGMLPPPPPGMLPPGFRPPGLGGVLPLGIRPPPVGHRFPMIPALQQLLSGQAPSRRPLLQVSEPCGQIFSGRPFPFNRPPFEVKDGVLQYKQPPSNKVMNFARAPQMVVEPRLPTVQTIPQKERINENQWTSTQDEEVPKKINNKEGKLPTQKVVEEPVVEERKTRQKSRTPDKLRGGRDRKHDRERDLDRGSRDSDRDRRDRHDRKDDQRDRYRVDRRDDRVERGRRDNRGHDSRYETDEPARRGRHDRDDRDNKRKDRSGNDEFGRDNDKYKNSGRGDRSWPGDRGRERSSGLEETEGNKSSRADADISTSSEEKSDGFKPAFKAAFTRAPVENIDHDPAVKMSSFSMIGLAQHSADANNEKSRIGFQIAEKLEFLDTKTQRDVKDNDKATEIEGTMESASGDGNELYDPLAETTMSPDSNNEVNQLSNTSQTSFASNLNNKDNTKKKVQESITDDGNELESQKERAAPIHIDSPIFPENLKSDDESRVST